MHQAPAVGTAELLGLSNQHPDLLYMASHSLSACHAPSIHQTFLPLGEMCLQVTVGSGLPVAMQVRLMLFPSLMEISEEISTILGDTAETIQTGRRKIKQLHKCFHVFFLMVVGYRAQSVNT